MNTGGKRADRGFTLVEILIGMLISSVVLTGLYRMWLSSSEQSVQLRQKIEVRNQITLASKNLQSAITLAGFGMQGVKNIEKFDGVGTDTLLIFSNKSSHQTALGVSYWSGQDHFNVSDPSIFSGAAYIAIKDDAGGEIRKITWKNSNNIGVEEAIGRNFDMDNSIVMPIFLDKYYTDQTHQKLMAVSNGAGRIIGHNLTNFQVAFKDKDGVSTSIVNDIRSVTFSFTGVFSAKEGAISNINFTTTAIPRNLI